MKSCRQITFIFFGGRCFDSCENVVSSSSKAFSSGLMPAGLRGGQFKQERGVFDERLIKEDWLVAQCVETDSLPPLLCMSESVRSVLLGLLILSLETLTDVLSSLLVDDLLPLLLSLWCPLQCFSSCSLSLQFLRLEMWRHVAHHVIFGSVRRDWWMLGRGKSRYYWMQGCELVRAKEIHKFFLLPGVMAASLLSACAIVSVLSGRTVFPCSDCCELEPELSLLAESSLRFLGHWMEDVTP
ncbi:hypothetical protein FQN60_014206 [Etheostoma spectabile]|uniref:Uncharacterized protein n=1 Tax=Etheostoma spectabile TaxID=54343 RepID=A0A5J5D6E0_9PERO|nr:hypothetical protein FQN60_014206 [Etheostoma spectabile]